MAINKPFDRHFISIGGEIKTGGGSLTLAKGQIALVDLSKTTPSGVVALGNLNGFPRDKKTLAIREGVSDKSPNRTNSNAGKSTPAFSLNEIRKIRVSAPSRTEQSVDEVIIGYDGFDPTTAFNFKKGDRYFNLSAEISGGLLQYRGGGEDVREVANVNIHMPACDPFNTCDTCDDCDAVDCKAVVLEAIEILKRKQVSGGAEWSEFVDITPVFSCNEDPVQLQGYTFYSLDVCDTGDDNALALIQSQYPFKVRRLNRRGSTSTYEVLTDDYNIGTPAPYSQTLPSIMKGCESCPAGYTASPEGYVYAITIEDDGSNLGTTITSNLSTGTYVLNTITKHGNDNGVGFYTAVYSELLTQTDISSFVNVPNNVRGTATVSLIGKVDAVCSNPTVTTTPWVAGKQCNASVDMYDIVLKDGKCGESRLSELNIAYPINDGVINPYIILSFNLAGTNGSLSVSLFGVDYVFTFNTDLATTVSDFIALYQSQLDNLGILISGSGASISFEGDIMAIANLSPTNISGDLTLTSYARVDSNNFGAGCQRKYSTFVISNLVCEECSDEFLDSYISSAPEPYDGVKWVKRDLSIYHIGGTPTPTNCLCGIRFKGKPFYLEGDEALRDLVGFTESSVQIQVAGGFPDEVREGIGYIPKGTYPVKYLSRFEPRTHLAGNLLDAERESQSYFLNKGRRLDYQGRVLQGETSSFSDLGTQYVDYVIEIAHEGITQGFARGNTKNIAYHVLVEVGRHNAIENLINNIAANAGLPPVKAFGL